MQLDRRNQKVMQRDYDFASYQQLLSLEKERCERYQHYFALFGLRVSGTVPPAFNELLQQQLRCSDHVFTVANTEWWASIHEKVGILLPETDLAGALVVRIRLAELCMSRNLPAHIGLAIYPDSGTRTDVLLDKAFQIRLANG